MSGLDPVQLGAEIRRRRVALGWTLERLAEASGLSPNYLGTVESGRRDMHISTLSAITRALGCSFADLFVEPGRDLSPQGLEVGRLFDRASPNVKDAALLMMRLLVTPDGPDAPNEMKLKRGAGKSPRKPRDRGSSS